VNVGLTTKALEKSQEEEKKSDLKEGKSKTRSLEGGGKHWGEKRKERRRREIEKKRGMRNDRVGHKR